MAWTMVDGVLMPSEQATVPADDPAVTLGWSVFDTLSWPDGDVPLHLARLRSSAEAALVPMPSESLLQDEITRVGEAVGGPSRVRVTLTGGGVRLVRAEPLDPHRRHQPIRAVRGQHRADPVLGGLVKHGSRLPWVVAVKRSGVDEVLLVEDGRFIEGTTSGILAVVDGVLVTAPDDGSALLSTTVASLLQRASERGVDVRRAYIDAAGPWDALYIASATRDLAPVVELDGVPLNGWDPVGRLLTGT